MGSLGPLGRRESVFTFAGSIGRLEIVTTCPGSALTSRLPIPTDSRVIAIALVVTLASSARASMRAQSSGGRRRDLTTVFMPQCVLQIGPPLKGCNTGFVLQTSFLRRHIQQSSLISLDIHKRL